MDATVILDHRFRIDSKGRVCALTMFGDSFWSRYLETFDSVRVVCRVEPAKPNEDVEPITLERVRFFPVPFYEGPQQYVLKHAGIRKIVREVLDAKAAVILRVPQFLSLVAHRLLKRAKRPFGIEVVGDPWDVFSPGAERHLLRPLFQRYFSARLRDVCRDAAASSYVTESSLQRRYPPAEHTFSTHASSVEIAEVAGQARDADSFRERPFKLLYVGTLNRLYKGPDTLIQATGNLLRQGLDVHLTIVGDGQFRAELEHIAEKAGARGQIEFLGNLRYGGDVHAQMDRAQLFVLPSRQEGLARTVIEALSRGLPSVTSDVGGLPEVVPQECLVKPADVTALSEKLAEVIDKPSRLAELSAIGLATARLFLASAIEPRRQQFFRNLRDITDEFEGNVARAAPSMTSRVEAN